MEEVQIWNSQFGTYIQSSICPVNGCSNTIIKDRHCNGNNHGQYGVWEIDHKYPSSKGGSDRLSNKRAICCNCNREKNDSTSSKWR